jgi:RHS repeat-associated protein
MWLDASVGLYYVRARVYDATVGRFLSNDPAEGHRVRPESMESTRSFLGHPYSASDPTGRFSLHETLVSNFVQALLVNTAMATVRMGIQYCRTGQITLDGLIREIPNILIASILTATGSTFFAQLGARGVWLALAEALLLNIGYPILARYVSGQPVDRDWLFETTWHAMVGVFVAVGIDLYDEDEGQYGEALEVLVTIVVDGFWEYITAAGRPGDQLRYCWG